MKKINTFSANSLKVLDRNVDEFIDKYIYNLSLYKKDARSDLGQKFHSLICSYIKGIETDKIALDLNEKERIIWNNLKSVLSNQRENFIKTEYSFLIKEQLDDKFYYLTGRFDAIYKDGACYIIYDWKTLNFPREPENDLQTIVYLYALSKIYNTKNITMRYLSIEKLDFIDIKFKNENDYKKRIDEIVKKML